MATSLLGTCVAGRSRFFARHVEYVHFNHPAAIMHGDVIEAYPTDRPYPSCLILCVETEPVHVVAAADPAARI